MTWLAFTVALFFIAAAVLAARAWIGEDTAAAQHELLLDDLWDDA